MARSRYLFAQFTCPACAGIWLIPDYTDGGPTADDLARFHRVCQDCRSWLNRSERESYAYPVYVASHMVWAG